MSFKVEVIADATGKWAGNAVVFATQAEAEAYANDLHSRWVSVRDTRVVETAVHANYAWNHGDLKPIRGGTDERQSA
jgi:hypothetical protein